jgi:serine/threonine kinase 16
MLNFNIYLKIYNFIFWQSLGCLLYALAFWKSPFDLILERGDSVALAVQSGPESVKIPPNSTYSRGYHDLILWMLTLDLTRRPNIQEVINKVSVLVEAAEEKL